MNLSITHRPAYAPSVEFVERKGIGHPDTICDALADRLARRLAQDFLAHTGAVQHFNVDKAVLAAGTVDIGFGGGRHLTPARLILVGKANMLAWQPDLDQLVKAAQDDLAEILPDADPEAFRVEIWLSQSSIDLAIVNAREVPLSNDTSFAAVSLPRSPLEEAVFAIERHLNSDQFRSEVPVGRDIKVMGARSNGTRITVAAPVLAAKVADRTAYDEAVAGIWGAARRVAAEALEDEAEIRVNQADIEDSPYLTLGGTSAEAGDDGQVGRGNRFGGLITPYRPMSLEAAAGKNPAAHVGKTYHAFAHDIGTRAVEELGALEATTRILSSIGNPVTDPQSVHVEVHGDVDEGAVFGLVTDTLGNWAPIRDRLINGEYELF